MSRYCIEHGVSIVGGDARLTIVSKILSERTKVCTYGLDTEDNKNILQCRDIKEVFKNNIIITAIPFSKDGVNINNMCNENINIKDFFNQSINDNKLIITGKVPINVENKKMQIINILEREDFAVYNAIATAEGAIASIVENTKITIYDSNILILGFGRIGKVLANRLKGLGANVYCSARKDDDFAWIETMGYKTITYEQVENGILKFDVIVNTIPAEVLNEDCIKNIKKECFVLDLASAPGGIDSRILDKYNIKNELYLGIPGKIAPVTSAKIIVKTIENIIKNI